MIATDGRLKHTITGRSRLHGPFATSDIDKFKG